METFTTTVLAPLTLVFAGALMLMVGVLIGGALVLRSRSNGFEPLLPPLRKGKTPLTAVSMDDIESPFNGASVSGIEDLEADIERIFAKRMHDDPNPVHAANAAFKDQMGEGDR